MSVLGARVDAKLRKLRGKADQVRQFYGGFGDLLRAERSLLLFALLALVGETTCMMLTPFPLKYLFDGLLAPTGKKLPLLPLDFPQAHTEAFLGILLVAMVLLPIAVGRLAYHKTVWGATAGQRMVQTLRKRLFAHMHDLSLSFHDKSRLGDLLMRITGDIPLLREALSETFIELVGQFAMVFVALGVLMVLDLRLALVSLGVLLGVAWLSTLFSRHIVRAVRKQRAKEGVLAYTAGESLATIAQVKAMAMEDEVVRRFARQNRSSLRSGLKSTRLQASLSRWVEGIFAVGIATITLMGVLRILSGSGMTAGDLLVFVALVKQMNKPLRRISRTTGRVGKAAACGERILDILAIEPEEQDSALSRPAPRLHGNIELADVSFAYDDRKKVLDHVSTRIAAGERIAIVGRNGAGKTTLTHMLLRFYEPTSGRVLLDGADSRGFTLKSLREQFAVALQTTYLFAGTVRDNFKFCAPEATDEQMLDALDRVEARFLTDLPSPLDLAVGEGGSGLSGGERRKLGLACVLLRRSAILILDEPTSHIDTGSRRDIVERLDDISAGRTTLVITHDTEVVERVDRVIYLEDGRIAAQGVHADLWRRFPGYRALFPESPDALRLGCGS